MMPEAVPTGSAAPAAWIIPQVATGSGAAAPPDPVRSFGKDGALNTKATASAYPSGLYGRTINGFVTMSESLLNSIDKRLQKVSEDVSAMNLQMNTVESKILLVEKDVKGLPTWKGVFGAASAAIGFVGTAVGGAIAWLSSGGAKTLMKIFGGG